MFAFNYFFHSPQGIDQTGPESSPTFQTDKLPALPKVCEMAAT